MDQKLSVCLFIFLKLQIILMGNVRGGLNFVVFNCCFFCVFSTIESHCVEKDVFFDLILLNLSLSLSVIFVNFYFLCF